MVKVIGTTILLDDALHHYVEWPVVTYETQALDKFGDRRKDRSPFVPVVDQYESCTQIHAFLQDYTRWTVGGKNFAGFDLQFLTRFDPEFSRLIRHRFLDIGNKYDDPLDISLPDLETCRLRALKCGVSGNMIKEPVTHNALEDAVLCAELYVGWQQGLVHPSRWREDVR